MSSEQASTTTTTNHRYLHSKIRLKSNIADLPNLTGTITEVKRGGWFLTDNPKIVRPIRAREFDILENNEEEGEEAGHFSDGEKEEKEGKDDVKDMKESQKEESQKEDEDKVEDEDEDEKTSSNNEEEDDDSSNYDKDQFLKLGTTIRITSGQHKGRICTISERRVGIFLKISVNGDIRLIQPDEIEVIQFKKDDPSSDDDDEDGEKKKKSEATTTTTEKKKKKDFGHKKYIGASVRVDGLGAASAAASGRRKNKQQGNEAIVENAFSGEWYLVSDPDIIKALDPAQFEVVKRKGGGKGGEQRKRKKDDVDDDSDDEDDEEEEEEDDDDFLSNMQFCVEVLPEKSTKSLRKRRKKVNYSENGGSSDDMESWHDSDEEEEKVEKHEGKDEEEEVEEEEDESVDNGNDVFNFDDDVCIYVDDADASVASSVKKPSATKPKPSETKPVVDAIVASSVRKPSASKPVVDASVASSVRKPSATKPVVDVTVTSSVRKPSAAKPVVDTTETSTTPKAKEEKDNAKSDGDIPMAAADSSDDNGNNKTEEEVPVTSAPVILHSKKGDSNKVELLLSGISHLPPDTKIDVLNRKTGKVMRGDEAIILKDLPAALLNHADYEPIVPPPQYSSGGGEAEDGKEEEAVAEEDTLPLPADPKFDPWDNSVLIGVTVVVRSGPYQGITAKIKEVRGSRWVLDHEEVYTTLRSSDCHFIDDGKVDKDAIAAHYQTKKKTQMPSFVKQSWNKAAVAARVRRVGRTETNVRVSNVVMPQTRPSTRVRASAVEGKRVMVTGGEFRGLSGTISSCIPGGWYLVSNLYDDDHELDVLIKSDKLELIDGESSKTPPEEGLSREQLMSSIHSKASELRMEKKRKKEKNVKKMKSS